MARQTIKSDEPLKLTCICCGAKNQANFYVTQDKMHKTFGKIPYCKDCVKNVIYPNYLKKFKSSNLAIYYMCRKIDVPYNHTAYQGALETIKNPKSTMYGDDYLVQAYMQNIAFANNNGWGNTFDDSQGEDKIDGIVSFAEITKVKRQPKNKEIDTDKYEIIEYDTDELIQKWGNFSNEDLAYLETEYLDWSDKLNGITEKSIDIMVKEVCLQCLDIRKDRENSEAVDKKVKTLQDLLKTSGLIELQNDEAETKSVGVTIKDIEDHRPVKTVDEELSDVDNIKMIIVAFAGNLFRALGRENAYTKKFDELYDKYSIDIINDLKELNAEAKINKEINETGDSDGNTEE